MRKNSFRLNDENVGRLPLETQKRLIGKTGFVKTKMRLNIQRLGAYSIFRLTDISGNQFVFEVDDCPGYAFVIFIPQMRESFEDATYFGSCYVGDPYIELDENLYFTGIKGINVVRGIQDIEVLEEHIRLLS
ncbi:MAG: hypothetical protein HYX21_00310 [Candidatus Yanofskybacteria bacterium]|nr:hypothetical protein [Candidatus Yanofskybacteria bacterium]